MAGSSTNCIDDSNLMEIDDENTKCIIRKKTGTCCLNNKCYYCADNGDTQTCIIPILQSSKSTHQSNYITWSVDKSGDTIQVDGEEAVMFHFFDMKTGNIKFSSAQRRHRNPNIRERKKSQKAKQEQKEREDLKPLYKGELLTDAINIGDKELSCPEQCTVTTFNSTTQLAQHYVEVHKCPIIYYYQPTLIKFLTSNKYDKGMLHRCIIKFMYTETEYFLLEFYDNETHGNFIVQHLTFDKESTYDFQVLSVNDNWRTIKQTCSTLNNQTITSNFIKIDRDSEYCLWLNQSKNKKWIEQELIARPGCLLCCGAHSTFDCSNKIVVTRLFDDNQQVAAINPQRIDEFCRRETKFRVEQQNDFELENREFMPVAFIAASKISHEPDNLQKLRKNIIIDKSIKEKDMERTLEEKKEENKELLRMITEADEELKKLRKKNNDQDKIITLNNIRIFELHKTIAKMRSSTDSTQKVVNENPQSQQHQQEKKKK